MQIRIAGEAELHQIQGLLRANDLPVADVSKALVTGFLVAESATGSDIGIGGLEQLGSSVLLRSLAVAPEARGTGVARALIARLEDKARSCGQQDVWLLTTTAERFFERVGYVRVNREDAPGEGVHAGSSRRCVRRQPPACESGCKPHRRAAGIELISDA